MNLSSFFISVEHWLGCAGEPLLAFAAGCVAAWLWSNCSAIHHAASQSAAPAPKGYRRATIYCCGEPMEPESPMGIAGCSDSFLVCYSCNREICIVPETVEPVMQHSIERSHVRARASK